MLMFLKRLFRRIKYFRWFLIESWTWKYETCQRCGNAFRIAWAVKDSMWEKVTGIKDGGGGSYCIDCFIKLAEKQRIKINKTDIKFEIFCTE